MTIVIMTTGIWLAIASYLAMPVSTTHSTIGGVIGMTMMTRGSGCVLWYAPTDNFPFLSGVSAIVVSWIISPLASGIVAAALYGLTYLVVLRNKEASFYRATWAFPIIVGFTVAINAGMFVLKVHIMRIKASLSILKYPFNPPSIYYNTYLTLLGGQGQGLRHGHGRRYK
jgi:sodium-dependent phosphate transporter